MNLSELPLESILMGLVLVGVFAAVFFVLQAAPKATDTTLDGVRVVATGDAKAQLRSLFSREPVLIRMNLYAGNDSRNTALSVATAEISSTLVFYNRTNYAYGAIDGVPSVNCVKRTNNCTGAVVTVQIGPLDGMRIEDTAVLVEGSEAFLRDYSKLKVIKGVFGLAVSGS